MLNIVNILVYLLSGSIKFCELIMNVPVYAYVDITWLPATLPLKRELPKIVQWIWLYSGLKYTYGHRLLAKILGHNSFSTSQNTLGTPV